MKTLRQTLLKTLVLSAGLGLASQAMAGRVHVGGGIVFGGSSDHTTWQVGIGTGGVGLGVGFGVPYHRPAPVVVHQPVVMHPAPVVVHQPVVVRPAPVVVHQPVVVSRPAVVYTPIVVGAPVPACGARVVEYRGPHRRISQPMIHGHPASVDARHDAHSPWIVVAGHPSIW